MNDCWRLHQDFRYTYINTVTLSVFSFCPAFSIPFWSTVLKQTFLKRPPLQPEIYSLPLPFLGVWPWMKGSSLNQFEYVISEIDVWKSTTIKRWPIYRHRCPFVLLLVIMNAQVKLTKCHKIKWILDYILLKGKRALFLRTTKICDIIFSPKCK